MGRAHLPLLLTLLLIGCQEPSRIERSSAAPLTIVKEDGTLQVRSGQRLCLLADDALAYEVYPSPDGRTLAVETLLMSNLQTLRLYRKGANGCYERIEPSPTVTLWSEAAKSAGVTIEEIEHPRVRFLRWKSDSTLVVELSGETIQGSFDLNLSLTMP